MDLGLRGKKALVCAASKGLGKAIAVTLAEEEAELFLCSRNEEQLNKAAAEVAQYTPFPVHTMACDLSVAQGRDALIAKVNKAFPQGLDILIHNVGGPPPTRAEETDLKSWEAGFEQLFMSVAHLNQAFLPGMKENRWGRIVTVTSSSVYEPVPNLAISNAIRAAVTNMLKTLADEVATSGVTINCVAPGIIHTDRTEERLNDQIRREGGTREEYLAQYAKSIPMGRLGIPEEYAAMVVFLCSQQASYITGATISVDGGKRRSTC